MSESIHIQEKMLAINEALLLGSLRQHVLTAAADKLNAQLREEIAERVVAETAFRESEGRFRTLFELGPTAVYSCDISGIILDFNRSAVELWGREPVLASPDERFCGSFKLFRPDGSYLPREESPMADVLSGRIPGAHDAEVLIEKPDGTKITVVENIRPLMNARGKITGAINCFWDVTERKRAEETQQRVAVLAASNLKLELEILRREKLEAALLKSERHERTLRQRARHLAHQVLHSQEEERLRISRELHDQIVQSLMSINVRLVALNKKTSESDPDLGVQLAMVQFLVQQSVETVHQFSRDLRPPILDDLGLIPTLHTFLKTFLVDTGIRPNFTVYSGVENLDSSLLTVIYRVFHEALNNVARHAKADAVEIDIREVKGKVCMTIKDNGQGFKSDAAQKARSSKRLGLIGMQERVEMVGGKLSIQSKVGKGTVVTVTLPVKYRKEDGTPPAQDGKQDGKQVREGRKAREGQKGQKGRKDLKGKKKQTVNG